MLSARERGDIEAKKKKSINPFITTKLYTEKWQIW